MSGEKKGNNWNGYTGFEGGENSARVKQTGDTADVEDVEDVDLNTTITIIRKDRSSTDQPMLLEGVANSLIMTAKLQYFYVQNHSLEREHYSTTTNGQELLFYNCIATTNKLSIHIVYSLQYCLVEGLACNNRNLVFLGVTANKLKPFTVQCYIYNMEKKCILRVPSHKVSLFSVMYCMSFKNGHISKCLLGESDIDTRALRF